MPNINIRYTLFISFIFLIITLGPLVKTILGLVLIFVSLRNNIEQAIMAFSLIQIMTMLNTSIFGYSSSLDSLFRIIITIAPFILIFLRNRTFCINHKIFIYNTWFSLSILIINIINSNNYLLLLSLLKLFLYYCGSSFVILSFSLLNNPKNILSWLYGICLNLIIFSLIIYFFLFNKGVYINEYGLSMSNLYRAIFIHPNQVGPILFPFFILLLHSHLQKSRLDFSHIFCLVSILFFIFLSSARGSVVGFFIAILITLIIALVKKKYLIQIRQLFKKNIHFILISLIISLFMYQSIIEVFTSFALKTSNNNITEINTGELFYLSRGWRILMSFENFIKHPLIGIGFGVPTSPEDLWKIVYDPLFNIPISAPVEKSFFFSGILEEFGLIGTISFFIFYFKWTSMVLRNADSIFTVILFFSILTLSIFEFHFFSMGNYSFNWLWLGLITRIAHD